MEVPVSSPALNITWSSAMLVKNQLVHLLPARIHSRVMFISFPFEAIKRNNHLLVITRQNKVVTSTLTMQP